MINKLFLSIALLFNIAIMVSSYEKSYENTQLAGMEVTIYKQDPSPSGITFILTGANTDVKQYQYLTDVLLEEQKQWVIGFYINVLWPLSNNHEANANHVVAIFDAFREEYPDILVEQYNIVGHSAGGKIALCLQNPSVFTNSNDDDNLSLMDTNSTIVLTQSGGGWGISQKHNAEAINRANPSATKLVMHEGAGHMAYTENNGGLMGWLRKTMVG
eukprot:CAMPEP_0172524966 /NCGR_PEP_ID=MMETSP1066-20121228/294467_1 /TAXON_ID=671091 /ORGANISM="Coscinodiscus wailesii, Strain CCMP2513" /LENGTH=215 /DNA_ID=CAMNT_0013308123 /DNA_START=37 /DNA_END=685 /DNA_ORIENTATION=+